MDLRITLNMINYSNLRSPSAFNPFQAIFLIDEQTSLCLISKNYSEEVFDDNLIAGMLKALELFISHVSIAGHGDQVREINYDSTRVIFDRVGAHRNILGVAISNKLMPLPADHQILHEICVDFSEQYDHLLKHFYGQTKEFTAFSYELDHYPFEKRYYQLLQNFPGIVPEMKPRPPELLRHVANF